MKKEDSCRTNEKVAKGGKIGIAPERNNKEKVKK